MRFTQNVLHLTKLVSVTSTKQTLFRQCHRIPILDLYQKSTGQAVSEYFLQKLLKRYPNIHDLSHDQLQCSLQILTKFNISPFEACQDLHVFTMNPITMDNYGEIMLECGFIKVTPKFLKRYHTLVRSWTLARLKKEGIINNELNLEEVLYKCFQEWPACQKSFKSISDSISTILVVRMSVLEEYLKWRLQITPEDFSKYIRNYMPFKHKPMSDIQKALDIAENDIKFEKSSIRRNGFIISTDPINTRLILDNVETLAGYDIRDVLKKEPAIMKNNYNSLLQIRSLLETKIKTAFKNHEIILVKDFSCLSQEYRITEDAQKKCLKVYCMCPRTVEERLNELTHLKEYQVLKTNPRVLYMVVHKKKMMNRLDKIQDAKKQCFSLNHLVASSKVFNIYISNFGNKVCGRDLAVLISSSLNVDSAENSNNSMQIVKQLKRHKFWLHAALNVIYENITFLKERFSDEVIFKNCQLLLYPLMEIEPYIESLLKRRTNSTDTNTTSPCNVHLDSSYMNLNYNVLSDDQIVSLVLYEIEKKYHFSGDGIWNKQDGAKIDNRAG